MERDAWPTGVFTRRYGVYLCTQGPRSGPSSRVVIIDVEEPGQEGGEGRAGTIKFPSQIGLSESLFNASDCKTQIVLKRYQAFLSSETAQLQRLKGNSGKQSGRIWKRLARRTCRTPGPTIRIDGADLEGWLIDEDGICIPKQVEHP